jgi:PAS domain S-box-containing protein
VLPHLRSQANRGARVDLTRFALVLIISLLVSRLSQVRRRTEASLRRVAEDLEIRVHERTEEAVRAAAAMRDAEERLRFVMDSAEIGYWDYDVERDQTTRSRKYDEIFGYQEAQPSWSHEAFLQQVHPGDREEVEAAHQKALSAGKASIEFRIVRPDLSVRWMWLQAQANREVAEKPTHVSGVVMDITRRRRNADSLREQAQLLDLAHDSILSMDWNGTITWNRCTVGHARKLWGETATTCCKRRSPSL